MRHKRISSRNTRFFIHLLMHCNNFIAWHLVAIYKKHHDDSPRQNALVGVPCGPSSFNLGNVKCVAIGECSKNVYNHLVYCKSATSRHYTQ